MSLIFKKKEKASDEILGQRVYPLNNLLIISCLYNVHLHSNPVDRRETVEIHDYVFSDVFELRLHF